MYLIIAATLQLLTQYHNKNFLIGLYIYIYILFKIILFSKERLYGKEQIRNIKHFLNFIA